MACTNFRGHVCVQVLDVLKKFWIAENLLFKQMNILSQ